jgi:hypothetical protein
MTERYALLSPSDRFTANYPDANYTFSWNDVPASLATSSQVTAGQFLFSVSLGTVSKGTTVSIDPTIVSGVGYFSTAYTFQRKVFYNSKSGYYFAFYYYNFTQGYGYSSSSNGIDWSPMQILPLPPMVGGDDPSVQPSVLNLGQQVYVVAGGSTYKDCSGNNCTAMTTAQVQFLNGTISGGSITWTSRILDSDWRSCTSWTSSGCTVSVGYRYVNIGVTSKNHLAFSYNWFEIAQRNVYRCNGLSTYSESYLYLNYGVRQIVQSNSSCDITASYNQDRSILIAGDNVGDVRIVYQYQGTNSAPSLLTTLYDVSGAGGSTDTLQSTVPDNDQFSAVSDSNYGTHIVYETTGGTVNYAYRASGLSSSNTTSNIFGRAVTDPTITVDYSTNNVYAIAVVTGTQGYSLIMRGKSLNQNWSDRTPSFPVTGRKTINYLTSNTISASATNSSHIAVVWTEGTAFPVNVTFASIPIQTVWSPFTSPSDPWDGNGLAPYGQYFQNLGEYVSPSTGMLTVRQTDLTVPGRGMSLEIARIYTEPSSFLNCSFPTQSCQTLNYEVYPWAPMGNGWQLNFPWMNNTNHPLYMHLWNGEGYQIPSSFWLGPTSSFENHQGENFRVIRSSDGSISLYDKSGTLYYFNTTSHMLAKIVDSTGNNMISFSYSGNTIYCITDTVGCLG